MKRTLLLTLISIFFLSCGQQKDKTGNSGETLVSTLVDTSAAKEVNKPVVHDNNCQYENEVSTLGIGVIIAPTQFDIFNDSILTNKFASRDMYSEDGNKTGICSKFFKPDYGIMHFVCVGKTDNAYKVLINYSEIKYFPKIKKYEFMTWDKYILQSFGIRRLTAETGDISQKLPLRHEPNDNATILTIPKGQEMFCPMEIKGDWVKVKYDCFYNDDNNPNEGEPCHNFIDKCKNPLTGWLRWRQENKLLIDIFLMP